MHIDVRQTFGFETLRDDGARMVFDALSQAKGKDVTQTLAGGMEMMLNSAIKGMLKDPSSNQAATNLARLSGLLGALAMVAGRLPAAGVSFTEETDESGARKLTMKLPGATP
jgi:hypothetical protein